MNKIVSSLLLTSAAFVLAPSAMAQDNSEALKSKLYIAAEAAYSQQDYTTAVAKYREYLKLDPNNAQAQARLVESEKAVVAKASAESSAAAAAEPTTDFERIVADRNALYVEVDAALLEAQGLLNVGNIAKALRLLGEIESALPNTPASVAYFDRINSMRHSALALQSTRTSEDMQEQERRNIRVGVAAARKALEKGRDERTHGYLADAIQSLNEAKKILPNVTSCADLSLEIDEERALVYTAYFFEMVDKRSATEAETYLKYVEDLLGTKHKLYVRLNEFYKEWRNTAASQNPATINPNFIRNEANGMEMLHRGKAQYLYGDYHGALESYSQALLFLPDNAEAKRMQIHIRQVLANSGAYNRELTREVLLADIDEKWRLAQVFTSVKPTKEAAEQVDPLVARMARIKVPVALKDASLQRALETLSELSQTYDEVGKGVDIVLFDPEGKAKEKVVSVTMQATPLDKVLDVILRQNGCSYQVKDGRIEVTPNLAGDDFETREFTLQPKVVTRIAGRAGESDGGGSAFGGSGDGDENREEAKIKSFLMRAGVSFEGGRSLVYDASGNTLFVTSDERNLDRINTVLKSLSEAETKQVNIEAKFIEVNTTALNQVVMNWQATKGEESDEDYFIRSSTNNRTIAGAHEPASETAVTRVSEPKKVYTDDEGNVTAEIPGNLQEFDQSPPKITRQPYYGSGANPTFTGVIGTIGDYDLRMVLNALSAKDGTDLMAAPSLTVQSEQEANIKIVQLLRWPQSYDDMQIQVSSSSSWSNNNNSTSSSASVGITPGTPQFDEDATEVGIQLRVQPQVNNEEGSITFSSMNASIKEFEGFVEYGGTAVAISNGTVVTTPAGFYQPVFNLREVETSVEVFDGGTIVIGGLTREEIRTVNDKVPILGDLPLIGSAFRSTGKSVTKKNLLIFVTANLIARGGGASGGTFRGAEAGATYSNPTLFISSGPTYREYDASITDSAVEQPTPAETVR